MPSILVTGSSAGLGHATVKRFARGGWKVAATMRSPEKEKELAQLENVACLRLDVTDTASIEAAVAEAVARFGHLDAIVNNAGYGLHGPFESLGLEQIRRQFETNVFGAMEVIRAVLPHFRERKAGTIVNVTSMGGRITFPLYSVYHSSKWALEGFSESLHYELRPFGIRIKIVEPGVIRTDFYGRSADTALDGVPGPYQDYARKAMANMTPDARSGSSSEQVAEVIWRAATDGSDTIRYIAGGDAKQILTARRLLPEKGFYKLIRSVVEK